MKILSKEEERQHYNTTVKGGIGGGLLGTALGSLGVYAASARYPAFRSLTLPFRAFLIASSGTFAAIVSADHYSRSFETSRQPGHGYKDSAVTLRKQLEAERTSLQRLTAWATENRYKIVFGAWVLSMGGALALVGRNPYLTGQQKLVQARVYAQGLTVAVLVTSFAFEAGDSAQGKGRWETVKVADPEDPGHTIEKKVHHERYAGEDQWKDMIESEERKIKERERRMKERAEKVNGSTKAGKKDIQHGGESDKQ